MAASNNSTNDNERTAEPHNRPTMEALHQLLQNRQWDQVQHSIRLDASVAMMIDDSAEEDCWVEEVRRRWIASAADDDETEQITSDKLRHFYKQMKMKNKCKSSSREEDDGDPPMQLRYWVGNGMNNNNTSEAYKLRRMTLLHSLCRLDFSSQ